MSTPHFWAAFARRLAAARADYEARHPGQRLTHTALGKLIGSVEGVDIVSHVTVGKWMAGQAPSFAHVRALARVLGVDPGWLGFGDESAAPAPAAWAAYATSDERDAAAILAENAREAELVAEAEAAHARRQRPSKRRDRRAGGSG